MIKINGAIYLSHQFAYLFNYDEEAGSMIDHKNINPSNNRYKVSERILSP